MAKLNLPKHAQRVSTYEELGRVASAFADGLLNFVVVLGSAGTGKSRAFQDVVGTAGRFVSGNATPFGVYLHAYQHRGRPMVLDDVDGLIRDKQGLRLLKSLCQLESEKTVSWLSDTRALARRGVPATFTTTSTVALIANDWSPSNPHVLALQDRAHLILFEPSALEIHQHAATFFWDAEIFSFVADHLHLAQPHSLRTYVLAWEYKRAGLDWRQLVLSRMISGKALVVASLKADLSYPTEEERVKAFVAGGHGSRATYFNVARQLKAIGAVPAIAVQGKVPSAPRTPDQDILEMLRRRFGSLGNG